MRSFLTHALLVAALCAAAVPSALAQHREFRAYRTDHAFVDSARQLVSALQRSGAPPHVVVSARTLLRRLNRHRRGSAYPLFMQLRSAMHSRRFEPPEALLDAWYDFAFHWRRTRRGSRHSSRRPDPVVVSVPAAHVVAPLAPSTLVFDGVFGSMPVRFVAASHHALKAQCQELLSRVPSDYVDDVRVFGRRHRNGPSYWSPEQLCSLAAANARLTYRTASDVVVEGTIETTPFRFEGQPSDVRSAIRELVPGLVSRGYVDDLTVNGERYYNSSSYWSGEHIAALLELRLPVQVPVAYAPMAYAPMAYAQPGAW